MADGVWRIDVGYLTNAYLLADDGHGDAEGLTLVDSGPPGAAPALVRSIRLLGLDPRAMRRILLTHWHVNHAGSAARFAASSAGSVVHALLPDLDVVRTGSRPSPAEAASTRLAQRVRRIPPSLDAAVPLVDGCVLDLADGGLEVVATPGHTAGHASFLLRGTGVLFCGDAIVTVGGLRAPPWPATPSQQPSTLRRLATLRPALLAPGHGRLVRDRVGERLAALVDRRS